MIGLTTTLSCAHAETPMVIDCKPIQNGPTLKINVYMHVGRMGHTPIGGPTTYTLLSIKSGKKKIYPLAEESSQHFIVNLVAVDDECITVKLDTYALSAKVKIGSDMETTCSSAEAPADLEN